MDPNTRRDFQQTADDAAVFSDTNQYLNLEDDWDVEEDHQTALNFYRDIFHQPDLDPLSFAPHSSFIYEGAPPNSISSWNDSTVEEGVPYSAATSLSSDPSLEDYDFAETIKFMSQVLMEENLEQKPSMFYDPLSLKLTEKSFSDALHDSLSPDQHPLLESPDSTSSGSGGGTGASTSSSSNGGLELRPSSPETSALVDYAFQFKAQPMSRQSSQPLNTSNNISNGLLNLDSSITQLLAQNIFSDADSVSLFNKGLEEASKFLPRGAQLVTGLESTTVSVQSNGVRSRKNHDRDEEEEGRSNKQSAVYVDESELSDMYDKVLLSLENLPLCAEHQSLPHGSVKDVQQSELAVESTEGGKTRSKKQGRKKETVDLNTLLVLCAQAVSVNDRRTAEELLKQIRQHSSALGDASQRVAHYFANGLEARLVGGGAGTQLFYTSLSSKRISAAEILKGYQVSMSASPFKKFAHFFAIKSIMKAAEKAETLHIVDFGILYGFQWPMLIKFLSTRDGGPPKLRITGIEFPQPGFRPAERIEETGRRLANYCNRFKVPFEYKAIASQKWETIQIEDLKIERNEFLAVNCLVRLKNLLDETIEVNSPRNATLNLIRKMKPDLFVQSILNGSYNAPFFVTRFREALFHFSALYDMFDTLVPRDNQSRLMLEKEIYGREAMNVVACEGLERVERPETYKQWQARVSRAGFKQLPLNKEMMAKFRNKMQEWYHKDFVFDEDNNWMLQGWKGRILYASTCWVPA